MKTRIAKPAFYFLLFFVSFHAGAQNAPPGSLIAKADTLKMYYFKATQPGSAIFQQQFFDAFPNSFAGLVALYGSGQDTTAPLFYDAKTHIGGLFNKLFVVNDTAICKKFIDVSLNGQWKPNAVAIFQQGLRSFVLGNSELVVYALKGYPDEAIKSFWFFYFDESHPQKHIAPELGKIKLTAPKIYALMKQAHKEVRRKRR